MVKAAAVAGRKPRRVMPVFSSDIDLPVLTRRGTRCLSQAAGTHEVPIALWLGHESVETANFGDCAFG
jgi:hypothetical protein